MIRLTVTTALAATMSLGLGTGAAADTERAVFAGGCFWCVEEAYSHVDGVVETTAGFAGGDVVDPTYDEVVAGGTGHREVVEVVYDPETVTYEDLLYVYWRNVDPLDDGGQFCDRGESYKTAIFTTSPDQREAAEASKMALEESGRFDEPIVTPIRELDAFYAAEDYHQDYHEENTLRYKFYVTTCGRYGRLEEVWGDEARPGAE